jgi:major intracellular serine protease
VDLISKGEIMLHAQIVIRRIRSGVAFALVFSFSVVSYGQAKRYAVLGNDMAAAESALAALEVNKIKSFKHFSGLAVNLTESQAASLRANLPSGLRVINDQPFKAFDDVSVQGKPGGGGGTPAQQTPWGISAVNAPAAWAVTRGAGVAVCVVDSGLDQDHPDLAANIAGGYNYITDTSNFDDDNGHGTHVGGSIAALDNAIGVVGVAPQAKLLAAKALDRRGYGSLTDIADAIYGCLDQRNQLDPTQQMPLVVNMSFVLNATPEEREIVHAPIRDLQAQGVIFTGAAGNSSEGGGLGTPGRWPEVLLITGVDEDLNLASFSGWNDGFLPPPDYRDPDFTAPAVGVLSTWKGGGTRTLDGTSMATAYASGVVALGLSAGTLEQLIRDQDLYPGIPPLLAPLGRDIGLLPEKQGQGLVDALLTVQNRPLSLSMSVVPEPSSTTLITIAIGSFLLIRTATPKAALSNKKEV